MNRRKKELRKKFLNLCQNLSLENRKRFSRTIVWKLINQFIDKNISTVMTYVPLKGEVDVYPFIDYCLQNGIDIYVPRTNPDDGIMEAVRIYDLREDLLKGNYGIDEPRPDLQETALPQELQLIIVPGLAFDRDGYRLGFGGGYYDQFLVNLSSGNTAVAVAYSFQIVEHLPRDEWDIPVDAVVTEHEIIGRQNNG